LTSILGKICPAQGISQVHGGPLPIAKVDGVGLNSQEHVLESLWCSVEWFLNNHF